MPSAGVPDRTPSDDRVTPVGNVPDTTLKTGTGYPVATAVKDPAAPVVKVTLLSNVIAAAWLTVSVKDWVTPEPTPLEAFRVNLKEPPVPAAGVPESTPEDERLTPLGSVPETRLKTCAGKPVAFAVKVPASPVTKVVLSNEVMVGTWLTVSVKAWVASTFTPFVALIAKE